MNNLDKQYQNLLQDIIDNGSVKSDRTCTGTISVFGRQIRHNMKEGFPLLTTKKMPFKTIVTELLWFLRGDTNIKYLLENNCHIWTGDAYKNYLNDPVIKAHYESGGDVASEKQFEELILQDNEFANKWGELGPIYGAGWRKWETKKNSIPITRPMPNLREGLNRTYLGIATGKGKEGHFLSKTWEGMIARCYDPNSIEYPNYGACNVYVCDEWLEFERFKEDVKLLHNWDLKEQNPREYVLDKDGLGTGYCYSVESCQWITHRENANLKSEKVYTVEKANVIYTFSNPATFCREQGISDKNFSDLWTGKKNAKKRNGFKLISIEVKNNNSIDQIQNLINDLKTNPDSRRLMVNAWNVGELDQMVLPPCHFSFQCYSHEKESKRYLSLAWNQRSVDTLLGLPFNIASYGLLLMMLADELNMVPDQLIGNLGDVHLYSNHIEQAKEQIKREPMELPTVHVRDGMYCSSTNDFILENYQSHPAIKAPLSN